MKKYLVGIVALLAMLNQPNFAVSSAITDLDDFKAKRVYIYDTKENPKAKGLRITIPYPTSWTAEEGRHPNIIQKFKTTIDGKYLVSTMIRIKQVPPIIESGFSSESINSEEFRKNFVKKMGYEYIDSGATQIEGGNAFWATYLQQQSTPTVNLYMYALSYNVIYSGKLISITHSVGGVINDQKFKEVFDAYIPVFQLITSGIIFPNKWTR